MLCHMPTPSDLITRHEAASMLGLSVRRVDDLRKSGELPSFRKGSHYVWIYRSDVAALKIARATLRAA